MNRKAFVLLSGGLDSTTCLHKAIHDFEPKGLSFDSGDSIGSKARMNNIEPWVEAVSIDYGQRHKKEMHYATTTCNRLGIKHTILDVGQLLSGARVMLTNPDIDVPDIDYADIKGVSPTYVPFRNGLMLSALTAHAQKYVNAQIEETIAQEGFKKTVRDEQSRKDTATRFAKDLCGIYFGAHSEDAQNWAYPDCTPEFIGSMANAIYIGSYQTIRLHTPLQWLMKSEIVTLGTRLGVQFSNTWSCYKGEPKHCGVCPTCRSRKQAFIDARIPDPTEYADADV
jgi:7-cyano-7-deazaguanine synthase